MRETSPEKAATPRRRVDASLLIFVVLAVGTGVACYLRFGPDTFAAALREDGETLLAIAPKLAAAMVVAAFVQVLLPPRIFARLMGHDSGLRGMVVASAAGTVTPGGPMTSFPIVTVLRDSGTGPAPLVSYITAWSVNGLQRVFIWEIPLMGVEFATLRFLVSAPLGIVAGLIMRLLPPEPPAEAEPGAAELAEEIDAETRDESEGRA